MSANTKHTTVQLGIWTVIISKSPFQILSWLSSVRDFLWTTGQRSVAQKPAEESRSSEGSLKDDSTGAEFSMGLHPLAYLYIFLREIYLLAPIHFTIEILLNLWKMASGALDLYYSNRLLTLISRGLQDRNLDFYSVVLALACKISLLFLSEFVSGMGRNNTTVLRELVKFHFLEKSMHSVLKFDLLTLDGPEVSSKLSSCEVMGGQSEAWRAFSEIMELLTQFLTIVSELMLMISLSRHSSFFTLAVLVAGIQPFVDCHFSDYIANKTFIALCNNRHVLRMAALRNISFNEEFRQDRISNNLGHYIEKEFKKSRSAAGSVNTDNIYQQWEDRHSLLVRTFSSFRFDYFLIIFSIRVMWSQSNITLDDLLLVQQTSASVQSSLYQLIHYVRRVSDHLDTIRSIYSLEKIENVIKDGDIPYPLYSEDRKHSGAEIEFRHVSFRYPGGDTDALSDVSFTIKPGSLVVIVGVNGSGKTSMIKLLARLYDPTGGEILLDGEPLPSYRLEDVRLCTAILCQDHPILPLSLRENVALGLPERDATNEEIDEAINQGGAVKFVGKFERAIDTVLHPVSSTYMSGTVDEEMKATANEMDKRSDLSGGETQRLSASRTFMRLMGGNIRLLVADEPTSALDPEGEYELFKRLREHSGGKTVLFITHRFGHLTKFADLILCLKDGKLVEQGNHETLMEAGGEYKRLYELQARGFGLE